MGSPEGRLCSDHSLSHLGRTEGDKLILARPGDDGFAPTAVEIGPIAVARKRTWDGPMASAEHVRGPENVTAGESDVQARRIFNHTGSLRC